MKKLLIANLVYGEVYPEIFCDQHLKSLLDPSNIPAFKDQIEYIVFTDVDTIPFLKRNAYFEKLSSIIPVKLRVMDWPKNHRPYDLRYNALASMLRAAIELALDKKSCLMAIAADLVVAQGFLEKMFAHMLFHDAVFMQPLRSTYEVMREPLNGYKFAAPAKALFELGYRNMHPLWTACHWDAPQFTQIPDTLLWNSGTGIMARTFSISPIVFEPREDMRGKNLGVLDYGVPPLCKHPYWCKDWTDAPMIGVEPLIAWYPTFHNHGASVEYVKKKNMDRRRLEFAKRRLFYPDEETVNMSATGLLTSDDVIEAINAE